MSKFAPELVDRVKGLFAQGETARSIAERLKSEGINISHMTVHRMQSQSGTAKPRQLIGAPTVRQAPPKPSKPSPAPPPPETLPPIEPEVPIEVEVLDEPIDLPDDPRELAREDWLYYERLKIRLRRQADRELAAGNLRHYRDLLREARVAEERAQELRPPIPPDPNSDPSFLAASRDLVQYVGALVARAEVGEPIPARTLPAIVPTV